MKVQTRQVLHKYKLEQTKLRQQSQQWVWHTPQDHGWYLRMSDWVLSIMIRNIWGLRWGDPQCLHWNTALKAALCSLQWGPLFYHSAGVCTGRRTSPRPRWKQASKWHLVPQQPDLETSAADHPRKQTGQEGVGCLPACTGHRSQTHLSNPGRGSWVQGWHQSQWCCVRGLAVDGGQTLSLPCRKPWLGSVTVLTSQSHYKGLKLNLHHYPSSTVLKLNPFWTGMKE